MDQLAQNRGTTGCVPTEQDPLQVTVAMPLRAYIQRSTRFMRVYENYNPDLALIEKIREALPHARVVTVSAYWCGDCVWNVPKMARIAEHLPGWEFEIYTREDERVQALDVFAIPTFVVYRDGKEVGRIIENPRLGNLEKDLWEMVSKKSEGG